jgi:hypothetical protein
MASGEILSSTGSLGLEYRSFDRLYLNWRGGVVNNMSRLDRWAGATADVMEHGLTTQSGEVSRCVGRFLVSDQLFSQIAQFPNLTMGIEAAVPIGNDLVMAMFGFNHQSRQSLVPVSTMVRATDNLPGLSMNPIERIIAVENQGLHFETDIPDTKIDGILSLWQSTFGWSREELVHLSRKLVNQRLFRPSERTVWFSGLFAGKDVMALATAERLPIPIGNGRNVHIIESTEWRTQLDVGQRGYGAATVSHLNTQIIHDMEEGNDAYTIIAETNFRSGAYRVGNGTGMSIPHRDRGGVIVPQVLVQNVAVGDGLDPAGMRDFIMMYLGSEAQRTYYPPGVRRAILEGRSL